MPSDKTVNNKIRDLIKDPYYYANIGGATARLNTLAHSDEFRKAAGDKASDELMEMIEGMSVGAVSTHVDEAKEAFVKTHGLGAFLKKKNPQGVPYIQLLKDAAKKSGLEDKLFDDLHYVNDRLALGMDVDALDRESVPKKVKIEGEQNWLNYSKAHLQSIPHSHSGRMEYLAKAMTGAFKDYQSRISPNDATAFSKKSARDYAQGLMKRPEFIALCKDEKRLDKLFEDGKKDPTKLAFAAAEIYNPFVSVSKKDRMKVLSDLKDMSALLHPAGGSDRKWQKLKNSIDSIDLNDPEKCGSEKLLEILDNTTDYMKGRKSLRKDAAKRREFNQSLDILAVLAAAGPAAKNKAQSVFDRVNEVRLGHDSSYKTLKLNQFGAKKIMDHSVAADDVIMSYKVKVTAKPAPSNEQTYARNVFQPYPKNDQSLLDPWVGRPNDRPLRVNTEIGKLRDFMNDAHKVYENPQDPANSPYKLRGTAIEQYEAVNGIARALALGETQMYHLHVNRVGAYFPNYRAEGKRIDGSLAVISRREFQEKLVSYLNDPVVRKMAEKYTQPLSRTKLTKAPRPLHAAPGDDAKKLKMADEDRFIDQAGDPWEIDIKKLQKEYNSLKKEMDNANMEKDGELNGPAQGRDEPAGEIKKDEAPQAGS